MPIPPATRRTRWRVRRAPVRVPYGPSSATRVPGFRAWSRAVQSPSSLIVNRSDRPFGAAERENGWARHQCVAGQQAQVEVLAAPGGEALQVAAGHVDGDHARRLRDHARDPRPVTQRRPDRLAEPEDEDHRDRDHQQGRPVDPRHGIVDEVAPHDELVREPERDPQVGVEVDAVPGLVREPPPRGADRGDRDDSEACHRGGRHQHEGVRPEQGGRLVEDVPPVAHRPAERREDDVSCEQPDRPEPEPAVRPRQAIHAEDLVEPRATRHEDQLDEREVGAQERGDLAGGSEDGPGARQR